MWIIFLFTAAITLFTVQNISFKQFNRLFMHSADSYFLFSAIYFTLICLIYMAMGVDTAHFTLLTIALALMFAASFVCAMFFYMKAMEHGPLGLSFLFFSAGMLLPILFGIVVFSQPAPLNKAIGLVLLFVAFFISTRSSGSETNSKLSRRWVKYILVASFCNGVIGIAMLLFRTVSPPEAVVEFLFLSFGQAGIIALVIGTILLFKNKRNISHFYTGAFVWVALGAGASTAFGNYIMILLSLQVSALVQFPVINGALVITSILASRIVFKEQVTKNHLLAIAIGLIAIVLLSI